MFKHLYKVLPLLLLILSYGCGSSINNPYYASSEAACKFTDLNTLPDKIILNIPYVKQDVNYCGPASLSMVMSYYGYYVEQHVLGEGIVGDKGSSSFDLVAKANDYKFDGSVINCSLSGLLNFLSEGKPVIARILNDAGNSGHFVVVTGYDQSLGLIYINDPDQPYRKSVYIDKFESLWNITSLGDNNNSSNLLVLVYPTASIATLAL